MFDINSIRAFLATENTVLFCGAGFSVSAQNVNETKPPLAEELCKEICKLGNYNSTKNLEYISDRYIEENKNDLSALVALLKRLYGIKTTSEGMNNICSYKYRRIYTTNYDDALEMGSKAVNLQRSVFSLEDNVGDKESIDSIVHINGCVTSMKTCDLLTKDQDESGTGKVKLSHSSYVSSKGFEESNWCEQFRKDLEVANMILFIGYSLHDIDIERLLIGNKYKTKTAFVVASNISEESEYKLKKYGNLIRFDNDDFGVQLGQCDLESQKKIDESLCGALVKYKIENCEEEIEDKDIIEFIQRGTIDQRYIDRFFINEGVKSKPYLIKRENLLKIEQWIEEEKNVVITSEFGNGKTVLLKEMESYLTKEGYEVYFINRVDIQDLERDFAIIAKAIKSQKQHIVIAIDDFSKYEEFVKYIIETGATVTLLMTERSAASWRSTESFTIPNLQRISVDNLSEGEVVFMCNVIEKLGCWPGEIGLYGNERKQSFLSDECKGEMHSILLQVFKAPQMIERVNSLLLPLIGAENKNRNRNRDTILAICLISVIGLETQDAYINKVSGNDAIYTDNFFNDKNFRALFTTSNYSKTGDIVSISSLFALFLLKDSGFFTNLEIRQFMLKTVERLNKLMKNDVTLITVFKKFLKFSTINRVLNDNGKRESIRLYYDALKTKVDWLDKDPQFWLQYGMSELMFDEGLERAEDLLTTAKNCAAKRDSYVTTWIDNQWARLYLKKAQKATDPNITLSCFLEAHSKLVGTENDIFKFRQVECYKDVWQKGAFNDKTRPKFFTTCRQMYNEVKDCRYLENDKDYHMCIKGLKSIIDSDKNGNETKNVAQNSFTDKKDNIPTTSHLNTSQKFGSHKIR